MVGTELRENRRRAGWSQARLAARLGVTQAYLSLMETGRRRVPDHVARRAAHHLRLPPTALPFTGAADLVTLATASEVEQGLSRLGYPGLAYRRGRGATVNPAEILLTALSLDDLDPRLAEALPWLLLGFERFDVAGLVARAKAGDLQNRLGFTVALAGDVARRVPAYRHRSHELEVLERALEPSRLAREDTYGRIETSPRMRAWLSANRSAAAEHWNLLTDLEAEDLPYASENPGTLA